MNTTTVSIPFISGQCVINEVVEEPSEGKVSIPFISGQCVMDIHVKSSEYKMFQSPLYRVNV